ncbi:unnamed protein product [Amaranthus hypochondriacus]
MGKIVEKRKKKKGRPSLLDLQKRSLKQQQEQQNHLKKQQFNNKPINPKFQNPNPNSSSIVRRSTRRNPNPNSDQDEEHSAGKRREKELKQVLKVPNKDNDEVNSDNSGSDSDHSLGSNHKKRKIDSISHGSGAEMGNKNEKHSADATKQTNTQSGSMLDDGPSTSLPDKSLLLFILDRLQKKDTYGVFAEPVDPEELPDYHEVIKNPMDFSTVRKKLENGAYANLEQFEKDVFLICSNAMQYNAPETVYFRQARTIQELAQRSFENLRANSDDNEPEHEPKVVRRGRPPTKNLKRPPGRPPLERANSDFSEATIASSGGTTNRSNNDLRKASHLEKIGSADSFPRSLYGARINEAYVGWSAERYERADGFIGSGSKGIAMKHGKKHIVLDDSRRSTYMHSYALSCGQDSSVFTTFNRERKQLIAMGLHTEYGYARSLARFAAKVGPVAWKVASKKIERCLPADVKFGPGWVGENDTPAERSIQQQSTASAGQQTPSSSLSAPTDTASAPAQGTINSSGNKSSLKPQVDQLSETEEPCIKSEVNEESCKANSPSVAANNATPVSSSNLPCNGAGSRPNSIAPEATASSPSSSMVNVLNNGTSSMKPGNPHQIHQNSTVHPRINGLNGSYGHNFAAQMGKMIGTGRPSVLQSNPSIVSVSRTETQSLQPPTSYSNGCEEAMSGNSSTKKPVKNLPSTVLNQNVESTPPDLNVGFQSSGSPASGKTDAVQPDLALQL